MVHFSHRLSNRFLLFLAVLLILLSATVLSAVHPEWSRNLAIYEVNVRQYTEEGTFAAFAAHLDRLQEMGVGILWFMPIHPIGEQKRIGTLGSYYSVRDYWDVNPEFGTLEEFKELVKEIHRRGMYVILDWVADHTSWDNPLTEEHPDWYHTDASGAFIPPAGTNWSDVIWLDYSKPGLREYMISTMRFWVEEVGVDGFRCDAVSFMPKDFWKEAIAALKAVRSDLFFLAEADGREWHDLGFDMTYGWGLYGFGTGILKRLADGTATATALNNYVSSEKSYFTADAYRMYFTSTHDENSWYGTTEELLGDAASTFAVLTTVLPGMPLIYSGQEAGLDHRLQFFEKDEIEWCEHENARLYSTLLHLKRENRALWNGAAGGFPQRIATSDNAAVYAFLREKEGDRVLAVFNLTAEERGVTLTGNQFAGRYRDVFTGKDTTLTGGVVLTLPAWGWFVCEARASGSDVQQHSEKNDFSLGPIYPNPCNSTTTVLFTLSRPTAVRLAVYDLLGRRVCTLVDERRPAGLYSVHWNGLSDDTRTVASGIYLLRLEADSFSKTVKLILMR